MVGIPFTFQFEGKSYSGMFQKIPSVGTETAKFQIFDIDPRDYYVAEPLFLSKNYENDDYSFPVGDDQNEEYLQTIAQAVLNECEKEGPDRC